MLRGERRAVPVAEEQHATIERLSIGPDISCDPRRFSAGNMLAEDNQSPRHLPKLSAFLT